MMYHDLIMQFMTNDVEILSISTDRGKAKKKKEKKCVDFTNLASWLNLQEVL